jgi:FkbM family methyltransferase
VFVDVGAHVGTLSLYASRLVGNEGRVYSFELNTDVYRDCLMPTLMDNDCHNVVPYNLGVGDIRQLVSYSAPCAYGRSLMGEYKNRGMISVVECDISNKEACGPKVLCVPLDNVLAGTQSVDILKIDVEGYEGFVLLGASKLLAREKPLILVEIDVHGARFGWPAARLLALLDTLNYKVFLLGSPYPTDFLCVHCERLDDYPRLLGDLRPFYVSPEFYLTYPELAGGDQYRLVDRVIIHPPVDDPDL